MAVIVAALTPICVKSQTVITIVIEITYTTVISVKGLARPCTHLISLNQSPAERKENVMRLHVAKSRFFKKGDTIKIASDSDNEVFFDGQRTLNLNKECCR